MVTSLVKWASGITLIMAVTLPPAFSATGTLHFIGQVVEDPCVISPDAGTISVSCLQDKKIQTRRVSYAQALQNAAVFPERATISMTWINPEKSLGIVQVDYR